MTNNVNNKTKLSLIVAYGKDRVIGKDNQLLWRLSNDLKLVKRLTTNNAIIMGRKTYESLGKPLPNRINIVLTQGDVKYPEGVIVARSKEEVLYLISNLDVEYAYIFGGESIYKLFLDDVEEMRITEVNYEGEGDTYFPRFSMEDWVICSKELFKPDDKNEYKHICYHLKRK